MSNGSAVSPPIEGGASTETLGAMAVSPTVADPERIAWDGSLTLAERRDRLMQRYRAASRRLSGPHGPASLIEMQRILEAIQVLDARSRAEDDWAHFLRESAFA